MSRGLGHRIARALKAINAKSFSYPLAIWADPSMLNDDERASHAQASVNRMLDGTPAEGSRILWTENLERLNYNHIIVGAVGPGSTYAQQVLPLALDDMGDAVYDTWVRLFLDGMKPDEAQSAAYRL